MGGNGVEEEGGRDTVTGTVAELPTIARTSEDKWPSDLGNRDAGKALAFMSSWGE